MAASLVVINPSVARAAQIFRREKAEAPVFAKCAGVAAAVSGSNGLRGVFDDHQIVRPGYGQDGIHVRGQSEQMDRHDGASIGCDGGFEQGGIEVVGDRIDVHENRFGADVSDGAGRGDETERRRDDFVAPADARGEKRQDQGVGAGSTANGEFRAEFGSHFVFKKLYFGTENKILRFEDLGDGLHHFVANGGELRAKIEEIEAGGLRRQGNFRRVWRGKTFEWAPVFIVRHAGGRA